MFAIIIILAAVLLYALKFTTPILQKHHQQVEVWVSRILQQPVRIGTIKVDRTGISPEFQFGDVRILSKDGAKTIAHIDDFYIQISLIKSVLSERFEPSLLLISGAHFEFYQKDSGGDFSSVLRQMAQKNSFAEWLLTQGQISLQKVAVTLHGANNKKLEFSDLRVQLKNTLVMHNIVAIGKVSQPDLGRFRLVLRLRGLPVDKHLNAHGYLNVHNMDLQALSDEFALNNYKAQSGHVNAQLWFNLLNSKVRIHSKFTLVNARLQLPHQQKIFLQNLNGDMLLQNDAGKWSLDGVYSNIIMNYNNMFRKPLVFDNAQANLAWQHSSDGWRISGDNINLANDDVSLHAKMLFTSSNNAAPIINLQARYNIKNMQRVARYYPVKIMGSGLITWLDKVFATGDGIDGVLKLQGALKDFPYTHGKGQFLVVSNLHDLSLNYAAGWPQFDTLNGKLIFSGDSMQINADGHIGKIYVRNIKATIPQLIRPKLQVAGAPIADNKVATDFVMNSPLKNSVGKKLQGIDLSGPMAMQLALLIPLGKTPGQNHVRGLITENGAAISVPSWGVRLQDVHGDVRFTSNSLSSDALHGLFLGKRTNIDITTLNKNSRYPVTRLSLHGTMQVNALAEMVKLDISQAVTGSLNYDAILRIASDQHNFANSFYLASNLRGVTVHLPAPFTKLKPVARKFTVSATYSNNKPINAVVNYGDNIGATFSLDKTFGRLHFNSGVLKINSGMPYFSAQPGLIVRGNLSQVNLHDWQKYLGKAGHSTNGSIINSVRLHIAKLSALHQQLHNVKINFYPQTHAWHLGVVNDVVRGFVDIPYIYPRGVIYAQFSKLHLKSNKKIGESITPKSIPALHLISNDFSFGKYHYDRAEFNVEPSDNTLLIKKLALDDNISHLSATGDWGYAQHAQRTILYGQLNTVNMGALLRHWGKSNNLAGGKGALTFTLHWPGTPFSPSLATTSGNIAIDLKDGSITHLSKKTEEEIGLGRVLNLLSLQSLPRRLTMNFSDLTAKGYAFNRLKGDVRLVKGNAYTDNVDLDGTVAQISVVGRIGVAQKNYDLILTMIPNVTSSLPIIATIAGGPIAGAITWAADELFRHTIQPSTAYKYKITGSWKHPKVVKLTHHGLKKI